MKQIDSKYAFPLFTHEKQTRYMLGNKNNVLVSDLWSFWIFIIKQWSKKQQKKEVSSFLLSLLDQAKYFYQAAEVAPLNSQPLLYYYSFLNLGKIIITINGRAGANPSQTQFQHGIETNPSGKKFPQYEINIKSLHPSSKISVGYHLMTCYGDSLPLGSPTTINILEAMGNCLGIHRAYCLVKKQKQEHFIRVTNYEILKEGKELIARLYLKEKNSLIENKYNNIITEPSAEETPEKIYWEERIAMRSYSPTKKDYYNLSQTLLRKGIWTYTDGVDYIMYLSSNNHARYSSVSLIYCLMFFFGSVTRYHPHLFETNLSEEYNWLIAEFLKTQPMQFLYISTSLIAESYITQPQGCRLQV